MTYLQCLLARLDEEDRSKDGYYIRLNNGTKVGPLTEKEFMRVRGSKDDVTQIASAWREAGGTFYKVELRRKLVWDMQHVLSCSACHHCCELVIIVFCFLCTVASFAFINSPALQKERDQAGPGTVYFLMVLFGITVLAVVFTAKKLIERWRRVSTDVFVTEV